MNNNTSNNNNNDNIYIYNSNYYLVGGFNPFEQYEFVSWEYCSQYMESHKNPWFQTTNKYNSNYYIWLVSTPLKNMSSSMGRMTSHI